LLRGAALPPVRHEPVAHARLRDNVARCLAPAACRAGVPRDAYACSGGTTAGVKHNDMWDAFLRSFTRLPRRWRLALIWIPASAAVMGFISWVSFDGPMRVPAGLVVGTMMGIATYVTIIRSGGW
jgi:hypothetical protein